MSERARILGVTRPGKGGRCKIAECSGCFRRAGQNPVLDVRGADLYLLCQSCAHKLTQEEGAA